MYYAICFAVNLTRFSRMYHAQWSTANGKQCNSVIGFFQLGVFIARFTLTVSRLCNLGALPNDDLINYHHNRLYPCRA